MEGELESLRIFRSLFDLFLNGDSPQAPGDSIKKAIMADKRPKALCLEKSRGEAGGLGVGEGGFASTCAKSGTKMLANVLGE